jgi:hypothetical protein
MITAEYSRTGLGTGRTFSRKYNLFLVIHTVPSNNLSLAYAHQKFFDIPAYVLKQYLTQLIKSLFSIPSN